ncbi:hypothetical protein B0H13DRAFT_1888869 [Mycena leptocephala]|nr:hypothetical protein B0H13DRAFT_1888869 [Mycena leptocephala]
MLLCALSVLLYLSRIHVASGASCSCSSLVIPVHVNVLVPKDPTDIFAGLKSNASSLRRVDDTYDVYSVFCRPDTISPKNAEERVISSMLLCSSLVIPVHVNVLVPKDPTDIFVGLKSNASSLRRMDDTYGVYGVFCRPDTISPKNADVIQLLVHGLSYNSQYWSPPVEEFRNYSYAAFSCDRGLSSLAIDCLGVGLSSRPVNASDVQYPTSAAVVSQLARHLKNVPVLPGHAGGSFMLNFDAIVEGARSPFDGLILTSALIVEPGTGPPLSLLSTTNRTLLYPSDPTAFSPHMLIFDNFTKDVGSVSTADQVALTSLTTKYTGPVVKVVGSEDQLFCTGTRRCVDVAALTAAERALWPAVQSFEVVVAQGSGHDMNLDFFAQGPFNTFVHFVEQFAGLSRLALPQCIKWAPHLSLEQIERRQLTKTDPSYCTQGRNGDIQSMEAENEVCDFMWHRAEGYRKATNVSNVAADTKSETGKDWVTHQIARVLRPCVLELP